MSEINKIIEEVVKKEFDKNKEKPKITRHQFYFETALYKPVYCEDPDNELFNGTVDAYNSLDGFDTTYSISENIVNQFNPWTGYRRISLKCKRDGNTPLLFFVVIFNDNTLMKVGQHPSSADIQFAEIGKKYNNYLSKTDLKNYKKAIGLYAHGAGAGSFVYLRRIFENLIFESYENNKNEIEFEEKDFKVKRMEDKVVELKRFLPSQLIEIKSIYGILSKGVHELSEEECLKYFSPIKLSIELILDQKIEQAIKKSRDEIVKKELQIINQSINGSKLEKTNEKKAK